MYNPYIPDVGVGLSDHGKQPENTVQDKVSPDEKQYIRVESGAQASEGPSEQKNSGSLLDGLNLGRLSSFLEREKTGGLRSLLNAIGLEDLDTGDILLMLIVLLLLTEGDNLDLVITLGLMILLGLGEKREKKPDGNEPSGAGSERRR